MLARGTASIAEIAKAAGVQRQTVYRLKDDPAAAEAALAAWGL
jgi:putative DNA-invertase from lambdoid prophage Rac